MGSDDYEIDMSVSRKRSANDDHSSHRNKRPNIKHDSGREAQFKLTVPNISAGAIIGKGGQNIARLQQQHGINIRMSKGNDFYPGTSERICLTQGPISGLLEFIKFIVTKGYENIDESNTPRTLDSRQKPIDRTRELKALVTNASAGMVIGKGGSGVKEVREQTGAILVVKKRDPNFPERLLTLIGDPDQIVGAAEIVLNLIAQDKTNDTFNNASYANFGGGGMMGEQQDVGGGHHQQMGSGHGGLGGYGRGEPPPFSYDLQHQQSHGHQQRHERGDSSVGTNRATIQTSGGGGGVQPFVNGSLLGAGQQQQYQDRDLQTLSGMLAMGGSDHQQPQNIMAQRHQVKAESTDTLATGLSSSTAGLGLSSGGGSLGGNDNVLAFFSNLRPMLTAAGYTESAILQITSAMQILAAHNVLGLGLGFGAAAIGTAPPAGRAEATLAGLQQPTTTPHQSMSGLLSTSSTSIAPPFQHLQQQPSLSSQLANMSGPVTDLLGMGGGGGAAGGLASLSGDNSASNTWMPNANMAGPQQQHQQQRGGMGGDGGGGGGMERYQIPVRNSLVGIIIGEKAATLSELQSLTGAKIEVSSRRDAEARGTDERLVTITGPFEAVNLARTIVERKLDLEQERRMQVAQNSGGGGSRGRRN